MFKVPEEDRKVFLEYLAKKPYEDSSLEKSRR